MLLIDDLLLAPLHGLLWVARKLDEAASQEQEQEEEALKARLGELHARLEAGQLTEQEFEAEEAELLDRLDAIAERKEAALGGTAEEEGEPHD
jgi:hypothetical protein